jgi:hypothetical protein
MKFDMEQATIDTLLENLQENIRRFAWAITGCDEEDLHTSPEGDEWSPMEILAHVKACDDILTGRIAIILTHSNPSLQDFDVDAWAKKAGYVEATLDQTLLVYQRHRDEMLWVLRRLSFDDWARTTQHETRGTITLYDLVRTFTEHEMEHVEQLEASFESDDSAESQAEKE